MIERMDGRQWEFPLVVIGLSSITAYTIAQLWESFIARALVAHLRSGVFRVFGDAYEPFLHGAAVLGVLWLFLLWMYRRKPFLKL